MEEEGEAPVAASRPATGMNPSSRPGTQASRTGVTSSRPGTGLAKSRPATGLGKSRPSTGLGSRPATGLKSRPVTGGSKVGSRPASVKSAKVWKENETGSSPRSEDLNSDDEELLINRDEVEKGCWHSFSHCVGGMWSTREILVSEDKEIFVRTTIRELILYVIFLIVLSIVTFMMTSPTHYYYTKVMKDIFNQQPEVKNVGEFWEFMEEQFLDGVHWEYWYHDGDARNGKTIVHLGYNQKFVLSLVKNKILKMIIVPQQIMTPYDRIANERPVYTVIDQWLYICPGGEEATGPCPIAASDRNILYENRLLGLPRLRQLRVTNQSCEIHRDFQNAIKNCWAPYSPSIEDKSDFPPTYREKTSLTAWRYQTSEEMNTDSQIYATAGKAANRILGPIFFLCYVFFVFFVLLNMFLAIINDTYSEVKAEIAAQRNEFELGDYLKRGYNNMLGKVGMRNKLLDIENALKLANADGEITYEEVRQNMKKCNFSDMEIEMFFAKYDLDGDGIFSMDEGNQIINDLDADNIDREKNRPKSGKQPNSRHNSVVAITGNINHEEFGMLNSRVERMEGVIDNIVGKIDSVLSKLEAMERSKNKRKANMSKILDGFTMNPEMNEEEKRRQVEDLFNTWDSESRPTTSGDAI